MYKIAVLSSGMSRGSNLKAIAEYLRKHNLPIVIAFVITTSEKAPIMHVCQEFGLKCHFIPYTNQNDFEDKVKKLSKLHSINLIALAGFLKLLSDEFLSEINIPVVNIHPALLPKYGGKGMYGIFVHKAVWDAQDRISGATVHRVNNQYDCGKIIKQKEVDITDCSNAEEIALKVLRVEHQIYGEAIWDFLQDYYS